MNKDPERRAELTEHLAELRTRLIRSIIYVLVGMVVAWFLYDGIYFILMKPLADVLNHIGAKFLFTSIVEPFMVRMQVCLVAGLILTLPFITMEAWGFVSPGLTANEKRPLKWIVPLSIFLFALGVMLCYYILPYGFQWFTSFIPRHADMRPTVQGSIRFTVMMLLAFGLAFELPVFLMLLGQIGIINSKMLKDNWRYATVALSVVAAIATPSNDAFSMLMMASPLVFLYFLSIILVRCVEKKPEKE